MAAQAFPMKISAHLLELIQSADDPIGRQFVPSPAELDDPAHNGDPLAEGHQSPVPQVIHRYPHRVVFLVSDQCAVHCRFCMRKRRVVDDRPIARPLLDEGIAYIAGQPQINEVILSGGDPLMCSDEELHRLLSALRAITHLRLVRIHTRIPVAMPQRITWPLAHLLSGFAPLYLNIHVNHPAELTSEAAAACGRLATAGLVLGSQTVLLRGVNDDALVLRSLFERLLELGVRPYYLHQLDRVPGSAHFQVPLERGLNLLAALRGRLSGMAMPHFMVDLPGGGGKVALTPDVIVRKDEKLWRISNWKGDVYDYPV